jgi:hypothetical protein
MENKDVKKFQEEWETLLNHLRDRIYKLREQVSEMPTSDELEGPILRYKE